MRIFPMGKYAFVLHTRYIIEDEKDAPSVAPWILSIEDGFEVLSSMEIEVVHVLLSRYHFIELYPSVLNRWRASLMKYLQIVKCVQFS